MSEKWENYDVAARDFEHKLQVNQLSATLGNTEAIKSLQDYVKLINEKIDAQNRSYQVDLAQAEVLRKQAELEKDREKRTNKLRKSYELQISATKEQLKNVELESKEYKDLVKQLGELETKLGDVEKISRSLGKSVKEEFAYAVTNISKGVEKVSSTIDSLSGDHFKAALNDFEEYYTKVTTRLGLSGNTFEGLVSNSFEAIGQSPIVDNKVLVANISELVNKGVASDVELMAFLQTVADKVATTFDAFDANLLRLIRLQGQNNTAAYMGMEVALNDLFTSTFKDSSYLSGLRQAVSESIIDANAMLSADEGAEFSYVVQKWLGALYESGASQNFINSLASGINLLGTGNVQALSSNSQLQSLLAMSASRAGLNYADLLTGGLNASNTNTLLASLLQYLQEVSNSSAGNNVLRSAYGGIFNFGTSDLRAIDNLFSSGAYVSLGSQGLTASGAVGRLQSQINSASSRMSLSALFDNYLDNLMYQTGMNVANDPGAYALYKISDYLGNVFGDFEIFDIGIKDVQALTQGLIKVAHAPSSMISDALNMQEDGTGGNLIKWGSTLINALSGNAVSSIASSLISTITGNVGNVDLNAFKGFSRGNTLLGGESYTVTGVEPTEEEENPITWLKNIDKNTTNTDVKPIVTADKTMKNSIEELEAKLESMKFHINLDSINSDVILKTTVDYSSDAQRMIQNTALDLARRMVSVIYSGSASSDDEKVSDEQNLKAFISSMLAVNEKGSGEAMNVNLAGSDLTIKDMLVRRV